LGIFLLTVAVVGLIVVPEHRPGHACHSVAPWTNPYMRTSECDPTGLSQTLYDALRIGTWVVLILGGVLLIVGLINYARRPSTPTP
jgi:hypothetical protein